MRLTESTMSATHEPDKPAANIIPPLSPAVTRQRLSEEDLLHVCTAIDIDSSVIDYLIFKNGN